MALGEPTEELLLLRRLAAVRSGWVELLNRLTAFVTAVVCEPMGLEGGGRRGGGHWRAE